MLSPGLLVLDPTGDALGELALRMVRLGLRTHYENDLDEAYLAAREEHARLRTIILPSTHAHAELPRIRERVLLPASLPSSFLCLVGPSVADKEREHLRRHGVKWAVVEPCDDAELGFAIAASRWSNDPRELRLDLRVPASVESRTVRCDETLDSLLLDVSSGGARLAVDAEVGHSIESGNTIQIETTLDDAPVSLSGEVRWSREADSRLEVGIEFSRLDAPTAHALKADTRTQVDRFRL